MANRGYRSVEINCHMIAMVIWMTAVVIGEWGVPCTPESQQLVFCEVV